MHTTAVMTTFTKAWTTRLSGYWVCLLDQALDGLVTPVFCKNFKASNIWRPSCSITTKIHAAILDGNYPGLRIFSHSRFIVWESVNGGTKPLMWSKTCLRP